MRKEYFIRIQPQLTLLNEEQKDEIHQASLEILERTGILVYDQESLDLLKKEGCLIRDGKRVFIPGPVVEEAIRTVPDRITISNRKGERCLYLEDRKSYFGTGSETLNVIDIHTGKRRKAVLDDVREAARVSDYTAFFYLGELIEMDDTARIFTNPGNKRTEDYVTGRFG